MFKYKIAMFNTLHGNVALFFSGFDFKFQLKKLQTSMDTIHIAIYICYLMVLCVFFSRCVLPFLTLPAAHQVPVEVETAREGFQPPWEAGTSNHLNGICLMDFFRWPYIAVFDCQRVWIYMINTCINK